MSRFIGPRTGSSSRCLLDLLADSPTSSLRYAEALNVMSYGCRSVAKFEWQAVRPLENNFMAASDGVVIRLLPKGEDFVRKCRISAGLDQPPAARYQGQVAQPRPAPASGTTLNMAKLMAHGPQRDGMYDLLHCPSLMGDERIASRSSWRGNNN